MLQHVDIFCGRLTFAAIFSLQSELLCTAQFRYRNTVPSICKVLYQCCFQSVISMTSSTYCLFDLFFTLAIPLSYLGSQYCSRILLYSSICLYLMKSSAFVSILQNPCMIHPPELPSVCYKLLYNVTLLRSHMMVGSWKRVWFA